MSENVALPEPTVAMPPPGAQLAAAREMSGLSVADVARQLKLSPRQVEALESGDLRRLPGTVFVRGFIRNYARLVKLDAAALLANTAPGLPHAPLGGSEMSPPAEIPFPTGREFKWQKYAIAAIALLVPVAIFEFYFDNEAPVAGGDTREVSAPRAVSRMPPAPQTADVSSGSTLPAAGEKQPLSGAATDAARSEPVPINQQPTANVRRTAEGQLIRFRFAQASWVEIRDRDGRKIFSQFNPAGTEQVVSGLPPLTLVVGNAKGVDLTYNEQPVDLAPHTKVDVARLTLE